MTTNYNNTLAAALASALASNSIKSWQPNNILTPGDDSARAFLEMLEGTQVQVVYNSEGFRVSALRNQGI